jgi:prepilin-type N-terminal cleavage/methylation domain-containing protein
MKLYQSINPPCHHGKNHSEGSTKTRKGFILIESLIALAIMSILALSAMSIVRTISQAYKDTVGKELGPITASLIADPKFHHQSGRIRLQSTRSLKNGGSWRLYQFRTKSGKNRSIPIYNPPAKK